MKYTRLFVAAAIGGVAIAALAAGPADAGAPNRQPDAQIKLAESGSYTGIDVYLYSGLGYGATQNSATVIASGEHEFNFRVVNDGLVPDQFRIIGGKGDPDLGFKAKYFKGGENITKKVYEGKYKTTSLAPGASFNIKATMTGADVEGVFFAPIVAVSTKDGQAIDAIRFGAGNL